MKRGLCRRLEAAGKRSWRRVRSDAGLLVQGAAAATVAWVIARRIGGHPDPFFAPIAAFVALNASLGERGSNAVRLLLGVYVGIGVGELAIGILPRGFLTLTLAVLVSTFIVRAIGGVRVSIAQAGVSSILVVANAAEEVGLNRLIDATIGAGVALVFSQLFFSPDPIRFLRRAETRALVGMARALSRTARALEEDHPREIEVEMNRLRELRDDLAELGRVRKASVSVVRQSLRWWRRTELVRERESAGHLDLLGGSCLMIIRMSLAIPVADRPVLAARVRELAEILAELSVDPVSREGRERAARRAARLQDGISTAAIDRALAAAMVSVQLAAVDVMIFARRAPPRPGHPA